MSLGPSFDTSGIKYRFGLDLVRSAAIAMVLIAHGLTFVPRALAATGLDFTGLLYVFGVLGVELFFCLSGYLIGGILLDMRDDGMAGRELGVFLVRRWMRTLPLYFTVLILLLLVPGLDSGSPPRVWTYFIMSQNLFAPMPGWFAQSWSLTIEEWSYVILPLLAFAARRRVRNPVVTAALVLCAAGIALRFAVASQDISWTLSTWDDLVRKTAFARLDAIGYGVLTAHAVRTGGTALARWFRPLCAVGIAMILVNVVLIYRCDALAGPYGRHVLFPWIAASFCLVLPAASAMRSPARSLREPVAFTARISYALYLCHLAVACLVQAHAPPDLSFPIYILASTAVAAALSYGIERPIMRRRPAQRASATRDASPPPGRLRV